MNDAGDTLKLSLGVEKDCNKKDYAKEYSQKKFWVIIKLTASYGDSLFAIINNSRSIL
jgi:hypothetical protein